MAAITDVPIAPASTERFRDVLGPDYRAVEEAVSRAHDLLAGRVVWHVNSTARGGGVAEMLQSLLAYARGAAVDVRWVTIDGNEDFFRITKRIHNHLHGVEGDGGSLGPDQRQVYERTLEASSDALAQLLSEGDIVYLHDPQTAGMIAPMRATGARVVWRCHIGLDHPNEVARLAWAFLEPYVREADAYVFSRRAFAWEGLAEEKLWLVAPSIDAFSPKNQPLSTESVQSILAKIGISDDGGEAPLFQRQDGTIGRIDRNADLSQDAAVPPETPLVVQVSRWDRLKDHAGVLTMFSEHLRDPTAHLLLVGPSVEGVADDPEGAEVQAEIRAQRDGLSPDVRSRVHLASLPMADVDENAAMVNAIQRRATVVVQKSLAEGFGLTVAEAMWKARPVVASRIGGIQDQIVDGESGILIEDPHDLPATAAAIDSLLSDPDRARVMGEAARERVLSEFLGTRHLIQYMNLIAEMLSKDGGRA